MDPALMSLQRSVRMRPEPDEADTRMHLREMSVAELVDFWEETMADPFLRNAVPYFHALLPCRYGTGRDTHREGSLPSSFVRCAPLP